MTACTTRRCAWLLCLIAVGMVSADFMGDIDDLLQGVLPGEEEMIQLSTHQFERELRAATNKAIHAAGAKETKAKRAVPDMAALAKPSPAVNKLNNAITGASQKEKGVKSELQEKHKKEQEAKEKEAKRIAKLKEQAEKQKEQAEKTKEKADKLKEKADKAAKESAKKILKQKEQAEKAKEQAEKKAEKAVKEKEAKEVAKEKAEKKVAAEKKSKEHAVKNERPNKKKDANSAVETATKDIANIKTKMADAQDYLDMRADKEAEEAEEKAEKEANKKEKSDDEDDEDQGGDSEDEDY